MQVGGVHAVDKLRLRSGKLQDSRFKRDCKARGRTRARGEARLCCAIEDLDVGIDAFVKTRCVDRLLDTAQFPRTAGAVADLLGARTFAHSWVRVPNSEVTPTIAAVATHVAKTHCLIHALAVAWRRRRWPRVRTWCVLVAAGDATHTMTRVRTVLKGLAGAIHVRPRVRITLRGGLTAVGQ